MHLNIVWNLRYTNYCYYIIIIIINRSTVRKSFNPHGKDQETETFPSVNGLLHVIDIGTIVFPQKSPVLQINH